MLNSALVTEMTKTVTIVFVKGNAWFINEGKNVLIEENQRFVRKFTS